MMQVDGTYMNLFVAYQFYKIKYSNFTLFKIGSSNLIPDITFHLFSQILVLSLSFQIYKNDSSFVFNKSVVDSHWFI